MKIEVYPHKESSWERAMNIDNYYSFSAMDVDFDAEPKIYELEGWINGTTTKWRKVWNSMFFGGGYWGHESYEVPCLKAVVCDSGITCQIEEYRVRRIDKTNN